MDKGLLYTRPPFGFTTDGEGGLKPVMPDAVDVLRAVRIRSSKTIKATAKELGWSMSKTWRITNRWMDRKDELLDLPWPKYLAEGSPLLAEMQRLARDRARA